ncbi:family 2 glycosyl transferase [Salinisphaera sp. PC39]|uniref:glycosyltransferase family 2 protein n=1 Tax=Salinisphaera sp. PC39 TaxID=1304156 RepID=UPI00333F662D
MADAPLVSVILTTYNESDRIEIALHSIFAQTMTDYEVVVVDDGSTDDTVDVMRRMGDARVHVVEAGRLGRGGALKRAVEEARGKYVANLDADDEACPDRLAGQSVYLEGHPEVVWLGGGEEMVDNRRGERFVRRYPTDDAAIRRQSAKCIPYSHSAVMFRRSLLEEGLNYDPAQPYLIDFEFFLRVASKHPVANLDEPVVRRNVRGESYFQSSFSTARQNRRLAVLCARAIRRFGLPVSCYVFPMARLAYPLLPGWLKRRIRHSQGLRETELAVGN